MSSRLSHTSHTSHSSHSSHITTDQLQALSLLKDESTTSILAYTKHARSLAHAVKQGASHELLSNEQLDAIGTLSHCGEDEVRTLLERIPACQDSETCPCSYRSGFTPISAPSATLQRPVSGSSHEVALSQQHAVYGAHAQAPHQPLRPYYCTVCQRSYQNHFDWKKHEKEHEYTYTCMASGYWDAKAQNFACTHCGVLNPDEEHFKVHGIERCNTQSKRRGKIVEHLKDYHMVSDRAIGESLADKWLCDQGKQFWACGFCVMLFSSFKDRLQHIGKKHYGQGQKLEEWDVNKIIKGLLLQPAVVTAWETLVNAHCFHNASEWTWATSDIKDLQHKLEIGPTDERTAESLAEAVYRASKMFSGQNTHGNLIGPSNKSQYPFSRELSSTGNHYDNDVSYMGLPTIEQQVRTVPPAAFPLSGYDSSAPVHSGTGSQLRTPTDDRGVMGAFGLLLADREDHQNWAIDPIFLCKPDALKDDEMTEFEHNIEQH